MDQQYRQDASGIISKEQYGTSNADEDETMVGGESNMSTTPTAIYSNGHNSRPQTSQSADFPMSNTGFSPQPESDANSRYHSPNMAYQQQPMPASRPSSGLSGSGERYGYSQTYQEQNQRSSQQSRDTQGLVIKVGMVGDAQIGKTSLMVKYVEGSWDEDYIQTLGETVVMQAELRRRLMGS